MHKSLHTSASLKSSSLLNAAYSHWHKASFTTHLIGERPDAR